MENIQKIKNLCNELYCKIYDEIQEYYHCPEDVIKDAFRGVDELIKELEVKENVKKLSRCAVYENGTPEYDFINNLTAEEWRKFAELLSANGYVPSYNSLDDVFVVR